MCGVLQKRASCAGASDKTAVCHAGKGMSLGEQNTTIEYFGGVATVRMSGVGRECEDGSGGKVAYSSVIKLSCDLTAGIGQPKYVCTRRARTACYVRCSHPFRSDSQKYIS